MDQFMTEHSNYAFIVRIWLEPREISNLPAEWKGMIQHVSSGQQRYFNTFEQLVAFIAQETGLSDPHDLDSGA
jgi:hypothetical protein